MAHWSPKTAEEQDTVALKAPCSSVVLKFSSNDYQNCSAGTADFEYGEECVHESIKSFLCYSVSCPSDCVPSFAFSQHGAAGHSCYD